MIKFIFSVIAIIGIVLCFVAGCVNESKDTSVFKGIKTSGSVGTEIKPDYNKIAKIIIDGYTFYEGK